MLKSIKAYLNPTSKYEAFNMEEFAFALKVELEHGKIKDVNVTNNHPFLTAMIALAHMTESLTYYKRLKVMEAEGEIYEIMRKMEKVTNRKRQITRRTDKSRRRIKRGKGRTGGTSGKNG